MRIMSRHETFLYHHSGRRQSAFLSNERRVQHTKGPAPCWGKAVSRVVGAHGRFLSETSFLPFDFLAETRTGRLYTTQGTALTPFSSSAYVPRHHAGKVELFSSYLSSLCQCLRSRALFGRFRCGVFYPFQHHLCIYSDCVFGGFGPG